MSFRADAGLVAVLHHFGIGTDAVLGHGGEAWVFALDDGRVLRVLHDGGRADDIERRQRLVDELARAQPTFALPEVLDVGEVDGRVFAIERRLEGRSIMDELAHCDGNARARLIEAHLDASAALGDLHLEPRNGFGDLIANDTITTSTWRAYLEARATANLAGAGRELGSVDASAVCRELPEPAAADFVHLDAFAGNMLTNGTRITAVLDIGPTSVAGDRRFDPLSAAVYLASPDITPVATPADVEVAMSWLRAAGLYDWFVPAQRWLAAYWSFAVDDPRVLRFCRAVLLGPS